MADLSAPEAHAALPLRSDPYTHKIARFKYLTYRKLKDGGTWGVQVHMPGTKRRRQRLADEADMTFEQAMAAALDWFARDGKEATVSDSKLTVRLALSRYLNWRHDEKSFSAYKTTKAAFDCHVFTHPIADQLIADLTTADYQAWIKQTGDKLVRNHADPNRDEARRKGRYNANLTWSFFKAALYHAQATNKTLPAPEWKAAKRLEGGDTVARQVFLSDGEAQRLVNVTSGDFRNLVTAALLTGARVGELKAAKVRDFDLDSRKWRVRKSKVKIKPGKETRFIDPQAAALIRPLIAGKGALDPVFTHKGRDWGNAYDRFWREARDRAKLDPAATFYCLRHTYASRLMKAKVPTLAIAENMLTSVEQIEKHYGHFAEEDKRQMLDQGVVKLDLPETNIAALS